MDKSGVVQTETLAGFAFSISPVGYSGWRVTKRNRILQQFDPKNRELAVSAKAIWQYFEILLRVSQNLAILRLARLQCWHGMIAKIQRDMTNDCLDGTCQQA